MACTCFPAVVGVAAEWARTTRCGLTQTEGMLAVDGACALVDGVHHAPPIKLADCVVSPNSPADCAFAAPAGGLLQLFRQALEHSICFLMDLPGLRPVPPVRALVVGWGSCLADVTDLTNLQLAISTAVSAAGGAQTHASMLECFSAAVGWKSCPVDLCRVNADVRHVP